MKKILTLIKELSITGSIVGFEAIKHIVKALWVPAIFTIAFFMNDKDIVITTMVVLWTVSKLYVEVLEPITNFDKWVSELAISKKYKAMKKVRINTRASKKASKKVVKADGKVDKNKDKIKNYDEIINR